MVELDGATAVVTGGGSGIGLALVREFADSGCNVVVADVDGDAAHAAASDAIGRGAQATAVTVDVADAAQVEELVEKAYAFADRIDVVCNNAGVLRWGGAQDTSADDWDCVLTVNLVGVVNGIRAFLPHLLAQQTPAHIVNTASFAGFRGRGDMIAYSASKSAVVSLSEALRDELADTTLGVTVLCPANINTNIAMGSTNSGGRPSPTGLEPEHVARAAIEAIVNDVFYVFTYPESWRERVLQPFESRYREVHAAIERGAVSR